MGIVCDPSELTVFAPFSSTLLPDSHLLWAFGSCLDSQVREVEVIVKILVMALSSKD